VARRILGYTAAPSRSADLRHPAARRRRHRRDFRDEVRALDAQLKTSHRGIAEAVRASKTTVTEIFGVGPIIACMAVGHSRDISRFQSRDHYAAYNGTAPVEFSSAGRVVHRLSRRGNRQLNHAIHMAAVCQIRQPRSEGRAYRKLAAPKPAVTTMTAEKPT
jgi:transposase